MPKSRAKLRRERVPFKYPDTGAVAFCAGRTGMEVDVVDAALVSADRYYVAIYGLEFVWPYSAEYDKVDIAALRAKHVDIFAPTGRARPPSGRELVRFLQREIGLCELDARRFVRAQVAYCELMEEAQQKP